MQNVNRGFSFAALVAMCMLVFGCSTNEFPFVYKINVQQGNIVTQEMLDKVRLGMTPTQVLYIMGSPLLPDTFEKNRWTYIYSLTQDGEMVRTSEVSFVFEDEQLRRIVKDKYIDYSKKKA